MRHAVLLLSALLVAFSASADDDGIAPASWQIFESDALAFSVMLPPEPGRVATVRDTWVGKVEELTLESAAEGGEFVVQVRSLPRAARWLVTQNYILEQAIDGILQGGERTALSDEHVIRDGHPGRRIRYEDPERAGWVEDAMVFLVGDRLYFLFAARTHDAESGLPIDAFFESFHIR